MTRRRLPLIAIGMIAGTLIGWGIAWTSDLSKAEVLAAAHELVPPTSQITEAMAANDSDALTRNGPYLVSLTLDEEGDLAPRVAAIRSLATQAGWGFVGDQELPNSVILEIERGDLDARISIRPSGTTGIIVQYPNWLRLRPTSMFLGAFAGAVSSAIALAVGRRPGRDRRQTA